MEIGRVSSGSDRSEDQHKRNRNRNRNHLGPLVLREQLLLSCSPTFVGAPILDLRGPNAFILSVITVGAKTTRHGKCNGCRTGFVAADIIGETGKQLARFPRDSTRARFTAVNIYYGSNLLLARCFAWRRTTLRNGGVFRRRCNSNVSTFRASRTRVTCHIRYWHVCNQNGRVLNRNKCSTSPR